MDLIIICGPPASGKMTIGQELQKRTGYKLFYNHMSLELVNQFFDFGTEHFRDLDKKIRFDIFREVAKSDLTGLIFTIVWAFSEKEDEDYIDEIIEVFQNRKTNVHIVELQCSLEERLKRNRHPDRLKFKPSKRNVSFSENQLLDSEKRYRMNTLDGEMSEKNFYKIINTHLTASEVANHIVSHFNLTRSSE